jgi:hypothetical protein
MIWHRKKTFLGDNPVQNLDGATGVERRLHIVHWKQSRRSKLLIVSLLFTLFFRSSMFRPYSYHIRTNKKLSIDAIVTIGMCGYHATEMVAALRNIGYWSRPIYVISDSPKDHEECDGSFCTVIDVRGNHPKFDNESDFNQYVQGIHTFPVDIYTKWHKTQIFNLIPQDDDINTVIFMDADLLTQKTLMDSWLPSIENVINDHSLHELANDCELTVYPERWYQSLPIIGDKLTGKYNSGMMILNRDLSHDILRRWGDLLVRSPFVGRDQGKLTQAIEEIGTQVCYLPNRWAHMQIESDLMDRLWFKLIGKGTFLHIASAKKKGKKYQDWNKRLQQTCTYSDLAFSKDV